MPVYFAQHGRSASKDVDPERRLTAEGRLLLSIHGLLVESQGRTILVDTCIGQHPLPGLPLGGDSPFLENLERAGSSREAVDVVLKRQTRSVVDVLTLQKLKKIGALR